MLPDMLAEPGSAEREVLPEHRSFSGTRCGEAPDITVQIGAPAACIEVVPGGFCTGCAQGIDIIDQRQVTFTQVGTFSRPVIHLQIDIEVVVAVPGGNSFVTPAAQS